jgi:hypothetical protein
MKKKRTHCTFASLIDNQTPFYQFKCYHPPCFGDNPMLQAANYFVEMLFFSFLMGFNFDQVVL